MIMKALGVVLDYLSAQSRNKIILHSKPIPNLGTVNLGLKLSEFIHCSYEAGRISMRTSTVLNDLLNSEVEYDEQFGKYLSIENLGILFEPELKIDIVGLLDSFSQNNALFVRWEGAIDPGKLYFLTREDGIELNIKNLSHIIV